MRLLNPMCYRLLFSKVGDFRLLFFSTDYIYSPLSNMESALSSSSISSMLIP